MNLYTASCGGKNKNNNKSKFSFILKIIRRRLLVLDVGSSWKVTAAGPQEVRDKEVTEEGSVASSLLLHAAASCKQIPNL